MHTPSPQKFRFTKENAREMAAKSSQARRERKAKQEADAERGRQSTPHSERVSLHLAAIEALMEKTKDEDKLLKLSAVHSRLFFCWQVLTGTPNPGSRKVERDNDHYNSPDIEPLPPQ